MAKRLTDTEKWKKKFIKGLSTVHKLFFLYLLDNCDHAGIWHVEPEVFTARTGEELNLMEAKKDLDKHIIEFDSGEKWFIPYFVEFQYGVLNPSVNVHKSTINRLEKYNLLSEYEQYINCSLTVINKDKNKDKEKDKNKVMVKEKNHLFKNSIYFDNLDLFVNDFESNDKYKIFNAEYYYESVKNWSDGNNEKKSNWVSTARNWALRDFKENKATLKSGQQTKANTRGYVYDADKWARAGQS